MRRALRIALLAAAVMVATMPSAYAVIPSLFSPLQALVAVLPQILVALGATLAMVFSIRTWRMTAARIVHLIRTHKLGHLAHAEILFNQCVEQKQSRGVRQSLGDPGTGFVLGFRFHYCLMAILP